MKRFGLLMITVAAMSFGTLCRAQLAWDTEFSSDDFNNALTVISKSANVSFSEGLFGIGGGLSLGKITLISAYEDECVIALSQTGIAEKLYFSWYGGSNGMLSVYQSPDHNNWSQVFTTEGNTISTAKADSVMLATNTRYIKFAATGHTAAVFKSIRVSELKSLAVSTDEWPFGSAMVDDAEAVKTVTVSWTNIVASVSATDPHFAVSLNTVGQKNLINQTTALTVSYLHNEAGVHSGYIVIAGEGKQVRIVVSGSTSKYNQTLTWNQTLGECRTTDRVVLNAFASSGLEVQYHSSDSAVAYVADSELVIRGSGSVALTAVQPGNYKYNATESLTKQLVIHKTDPVVAAEAGNLVYGQTLQDAVLTETVGKVPGVLSWLGIKVDTVLNAGDYTLTLLFTPADTSIYNTADLPVALTVDKAPQVIVWTGQDTALVVGAEVQSTAVLSSGLPITYAYTRCLVSITGGVIMPEQEGTTTIIAYHPGNNNYLPTTVIMQDFTVSAPSQPTAVEQLTPQQVREAYKTVHHGEVLIYFEGRIYDAEGRLKKNVK